MKPEDLLEALFVEDAALPEDQALTALLACAGRARRAREAGDLAAGEFEDGLHWDEEEARAWSREELPAGRLAAAPEREGELLRYGAEGWTVALARRPDGGWSALLAGPKPATLILPGERVSLVPRAWTPLRALVSPTILTLSLPDGRALALQRIDRSV